MPLELPNLDDRTYKDLVAEALSLIPTYAPEWTNHNPSDPGITLVELFAFLSEMLIYRLNRVTNANKFTFLKLLNGSKWAFYDQPVPDGATLDTEIRKTVQTLRAASRAVTCADFEILARAVNAQRDEGQQKVARSHCIPRRNLDPRSPLFSQAEQMGHVSVVIVPISNGADPLPQPTQELLQAIAQFLEPKRILTTRLHVIGPSYVKVQLQLTLHLKPDALVDLVQVEVFNALTFFHPLQGGSDRQGWVFGRNVYVSELYALLDQVPGVDYVTKTEVTEPNGQKHLLNEIAVAPPESARLQFLQGQLIAIAINDHELVEVDAKAIRYVDANHKPVVPSVSNP